MTFSSHKNDKSKAHYNPKDQGIYLNTFCDDGVALIPLSELHNLKLDHEGKTTYQDKKLSVPALTSLSDLNNTLRHELLHETLGKQVKNYSGHSQEFKDNFKFSQQDYVLSLASRKLYVSYKDNKGMYFFNAEERLASSMEMHKNSPENNIGLLLNLDFLKNLKL